MSRFNCDPFTPFGTISFEAYFASYNRVGPSTVPKQTETPRVSSVVCVRGHDVRRETSGGRTQDGLECIGRVD